MARSIKLGPDDDDDEVPDKDDPDLASVTAQVAPPPLIAKPVASPADPNLSQLATPALQTGAGGGPLAGQRPIPMAPAPNSQPLADIGWTPPGAHAPNADAAEPPAAAPPPAASSITSPEEYLKQSKPYGDELRRRYQELKKDFDPGPLATPDERTAGLAAAYNAAEKEMAPHFLQMIATNQFNTRKADTSEERAQAYGRGVEASVGQRQAAAAKAWAQAAAVPEQLAINYGKLDVSQRNSLANAAFKDVAGRALAQGADASQISALATLRKQVAEHPEDSGAITDAGQLGTPFLRRMFELVGVGTPAPDTQQGRSALRQQLGAAQDMATRGDAAAQPPVGIPAAAAQPPFPVRSAADISARMQAANPGMAATQTAPGMAPVTAAPRARPMGATVLPTQSPPQSGGPPPLTAMNGLGTNIAQFRPGQGGLPGIIPQGNSAPSGAPQSRAPAQVTQDLSSPANEAGSIDWIVQSKLAPDPDSARRLFTKSVNTLSIPGMGPQKDPATGAMKPPSPRWDKAYYVVNRKPWEPGASNGK